MPAKTARGPTDTSDRGIHFNIPLPVHDEPAGSSSDLCAKF